MLLCVLNMTNQGESTNIFNPRAQKEKANSIVDLSNTALDGV